MLRMEGTDFHKLGWVKHRVNMKERIAKFQTGNPYRLTLLSMMPATLSQENEWHWKMLEWRVGMSEWFTSNPMLDAIVASNT